MATATKTRSTNTASHKVDLFAKAKTTAKQSKAQNKLVGTTFRVYRLGEQLRKSFTAYREKAGLKVGQAVQRAVDNELPALVVALGSLCITSTPRDARAARLPLESPMILESLRRASEATGLDQSQLLVATLSLAANRKAKRKVK